MKFVKLGHFPENKDIYLISSSVVQFTKYVKLGIRGAKGAPLPRLCVIQLASLFKTCIFLVYSVTLRNDEQCGFLILIAQAQVALEKSNIIKVLYR